jgi:hypothetical protein
VTDVMPAIFFVRFPRSARRADPACRRGIGGRWVAANGAVLAILLAGCSGGSDADYNRVDVPEREAEAQAAIEQSVAQNGAARTALSGVPIARASPTAARDRAFSTEFLGYWGAGDDDCELANTEATGRINIDADTIRFYQARARVQRMERHSPQEVAVDLRFSRDGKTFERREIYRLDAGGTMLVRSDPSATQRYRRC